MGRAARLLACAVLCLAAPARAQTPDTSAAPEAAAALTNPCPPREVPGTSNPLTRSLVTEWALLQQSWCKVMRWEDPWPTSQDFLVNVLTGPGIHPTGGIVVPDSGPAAGLALNIPWNAASSPFGRSALNFEARGSENGFWEAGAQLQTLFPEYGAGGTSPQFTLSAKYWDMPTLPFYGIGNDSSRRDRALFSLRQTAVVPGFDIPLPYGFTVSGELGALWFDPDPGTKFRGLFNQSSAPGLNADTTYLRPRILVTWRYPVRDALYGFSTSAAGSYELDEAMRGGRYSFTRLEARWNVAYGPGQEIGTFRFSSRLTLSIPRDGNAVPFYVQPTLGGADINDVNTLRAYDNYRFRDRDVVSYEISYERKIVDPVGLRIFAELGRVGAQPGDLGFSHMKTSVGVAASFRLGGATVAELSLAWGGGEGVHAYATGNTNNVGGVSAGLRGVF